MSKKLLDDTSKFLSYVLRHEPQAIGLSLDSEGWAGIAELIEAASRDGRSLSRELLEQVVRTNEKKRFSFSEDGQHIRAVQGHSNQGVQLQLEGFQVLSGAEWGLADGAGSCPVPRSYLEA